MTYHESLKLLSFGGFLFSTIDQNKGMVYELANKFYVEGTKSIDREDLDKEEIIGLIIAADKYSFGLRIPANS